MIRGVWSRSVGMILVIILLATLGSFDPISPPAAADEKVKQVSPETATSTTDQPKPLAPLPTKNGEDPSLPETPDEMGTDAKKGDSVSVMLREQ
ncbi:MAG: hypothetical protein L0L36_15865, partial [Brevibacterium sp.]|nr:hypothetical protein [Brevibacterium sp.]